MDAKDDNVIVNILWGIKWGLIFAAGISLVAVVRIILGLAVITPIALFSGKEVSELSDSSQIMELLLVFPSYYVAGLIGGAICGLLRPLFRWRLGATLLGGIAGIITYGTIGAVFKGSEEVFSSNNISIALIAGIPVGGIAAFMSWEDPNRKKEDTKDIGC